MKKILLAFVFGLISINCYAQGTIPGPRNFYDEGLVVGQEELEEKSRAMQALENSRESLRNRDFSPLEENVNERMEPEVWDEYSENIQRFDQQPYQDDNNELSSSDILYMFSLVEIQPDGKIIVTDEIRLGQNSVYKKGLNRSFPLSYKDFNGKVINNSINVLSASFNNNQILFDSKVKGDNLVVHLDYSPEYFTEEVNTIVITYRVANVFSFNNGETEMFWQVIGKGWEKRVLNLGAAVIFVKGTEVMEKVAFLSNNPRDVAFKVATDAEENIGFVASRPLNPREGYTIYLKWKSGVINTSEAMYSSEILFDKYGIVLVASGLIVLLALYYGLLPFFIKKDKDFFAKRMNSLRHLSPAGLRYVLRRRFDNKLSFAAVLNMVIKSASKINKDSDAMNIQANIKGKKNLGRIEKFLFGKLFSKKKQNIDLDGKDKSMFKKIIRNIPYLAIVETEEFFIKQNVKFIMIGLLFSVCGAIGGAWMTSFPVYLSLYGACLVVAEFVFLFSGYLIYKAARRVKLPVLPRFMVLVVVAMLMLGGMLFAGYKISMIMGIVNILAIMVMPVMALIAHIMFKSSSSSAKYIHDSYGSFKKMLATKVDVASEKVHWNNFDKYLPYAIALDVEVEYNDRYFAEGSNGHEIEYLPSEYNGNQRVVIDMTNDLEKTLGA